MNNSPAKEQLSGVLHDHYLEFTEDGDLLTIRKNTGRNGSLQGQIILATMLMAFGLIMFIMATTRGGLAMMLGSGIYLVTLMNLREREKESTKKVIRIGNGVIEMKEGYKSRRVNIADVKEFRTKTLKAKDFYIGKINIITDDDRFYEFLEIYGKKEDMLEEDLVEIANYLVSHHITPDEELD